jgi:VCBS repeat-containing protein
LNFVDKFDTKPPVEGSVPHPVAFAHVDGASTQAPSDAIIVPDAQLLFGGDFKRSGVDLVLSKDDHELVLHDYFKGEKRAALASPDGAHLTGDLVNALTGHVEYAQADGAVAAAVVVGHVTKLTGSATAIRNGVSIILNQGDNIDKGDVLQSGADSTLGVTFIDGTVFGLSSNARMVVNEMVYDPNGSNNSSLLSLVAGTISFVAGETAKHGDMKVDTPVATMGIRGTAVLVEIDFAVPGQNGAPSANFQVLVEPDGTTGSYILFDKNTLAPLATVNTAGTLTKISQGVVSFQAGSPLTPDEQKLINDLFTTKFGDNNTKSIDHHFTDTPVPQSLAPIKLADGIIATPVIQIVANPGGSSSSALGGGTAGVLHIPGPPAVATSDETFTEHALITGSTAFDTQTGQIRFADVNAGDLPTVKVEFSSFTYQDAQQHDITKALGTTEQAAIKAVEAISLQQDSGNNNNGSATWTYSFPDGAFDFLGAGETLTLTYTALVDNNFLQSPEIGTKQFTITITGTNDVPVITSSIPQTIAFVGGTSVPGGDLTAHVPTSGTISFDDPDLTDTHTVSVKLLLDGLNLPPTPLQIFKNALTASIATDSTGTGFGTVNWKLADLPVYLGDFIPKGETITLTYAVTVTDSQGATSTQDITVTITGTDTPAVVWIATTQTGSAPGGLWSDAANWETGTVPTANDDAIIITDQLIGLTPSYPVTIDATTAAVAKSLTMNDFGTSAPELINLGTLTVSGAFDMSADSIVHNSGTIKVGGLMEVLDTSVVLNSGALILQQGGDFKNQSTITNTESGSIEISGGTLNVQVDVANDGLIKVDSGAVMTVGIATITGGTVTDAGTLSLNGVAPSDSSSEEPPATGAAVLKDGTLNNTGVLHAETGALLQNETVFNTGTIEVLALGALTLDQGTTVTNTGGTIAIDGTGTLTLDDATIDGGTINNYSLPSSPSGSIIPGDIDVTGPSTISNAHLNNGHVTVESDQTLTFDGSTVSGSTITNDGILAVDAGQTLTLQDGVTVVGGTLDDSGTVQIEGSSGATLDGVTVTGGGDIQIDRVQDTATTPLVLEDGTIITDATLTVGSVGVLAVKTSDGATLDDVGVTNHNSIEVFGGSTLTLDDGTSVTNADGTITVDETGTLTLDDATVSGGTLDNSGTVQIEGSSGATLDGVTVIGGGDIQIDCGRDTATPPLVLEGGTIITDGTLTVGSVGLLDVKTAGATLDDVGVTNHNSIEVIGGSALTLDDGTSVTNTDGIITVDETGTLTLNDATISGGTLDNSGTVHVEGSSGAALDGVTVTGGGDIQIDYSKDTTTTPLILEGGTIITDGTLTVGSVGVLAVKTSDGATLDDVDVTNHNSIEVFGRSALTLDDGTSVTNTDGAITIDETGTLTLSDATISGGTLYNSGTVHIEGSSGATLDGVTVTGSGDIAVDGAEDTATTPLVMEGGTIITDGTLTVGSVGVLVVKTAGATLDDVGVTNHNSIEVFAGSMLTLDDGTSVNNADGTITIDGNGTLTLNDASISGGIIDDFSTPASGSMIAGDIDVTGSSTIGNAQLNNGQVTIGSNATLTLSGDTVSGTSFIDTAHGATILIDGASTLDGVAITGGAITNTDATLTVDADQTLTLQGGATVVGGMVSNSGTVAIESASGATLDGVTVIGAGTIQVDGLVPTTSTPLVLDDGTTITGGKLKVGPVGAVAIKTAKGATLNGVDVTNDNSIEVLAASVLALGSGTIIDNTSGVVTIDGTGALTLSQATIDGGTINDFSTTPSGGMIAGDIDVTGSSTISNAHLNNGHVTIGANQTLTLDGATVTGTTFADTADGAIIQIDGGTTLTLSHATINGGTINDFSAPPSGSVIAGDIDVTGSSTISNAHLNNGQVTIAANQTLVLDNDTITGTSFSDTASGAIIQIDGGTTLTLDHATINGGTINDFSTPPSGSMIAGDIDVTGSSTISNAHLNNGHVTIGANQTLTLDGTTVTGTAFADTADGAIIQIDGGTTLTLSHATINGGTINDFSAPPSGSVIAGDIDVTGSSTISNAHLNDGQVTIAANQTLVLDNDTITGTHFVDTADGAVIQIDGGTTLKLDHATIDGGTINDFSTLPSGSRIAGDIDVIGSSTISNAQLNHGNVTIESGQTLTLDGDTVTGTAFAGVATDSIIHVDGGDTLTLNSTTVSGGGVTVGADALVKTSGDVSLTNSSVTNDGTIEITGGTLKITGSVASSGPDASGSIKIDSGAVLDLDGSDTQNVVFAGANGELKIDASSFGGSISGLAATDEIDLSTIGYGPGTTGTYSGGVLTITDGTHSISMTLTGDYSDAHFAGASDGHGGTLITLNANDDAPAFDSADTTQTAKVTELADTTGSTAADLSTPANGTIHFTDIDLTDRPTATITQSVAWTSGTTDLSSSLTSAEIDLLEHAFSLTQSGNTNNGAIGWSYQISDSALDFLGAGETATVTSTVLLDDHQNGHDTATVTVTITGANDAPGLAADTSGTAGTTLHAIAERAGVTGDAVDHDSASGTLSFTDADLDDTHVVSQGAPVYLWSGGSLTAAQTDALTAAATLALTETDSTHTGAGSVGFTYSAADSSFDFLAAGETLKITYGVTVTDNHGASSIQPVTITITGTNDAPVLAADSSGANGLHAISELAGKTGDTADIDSASGTLSFTDADLDDTHVVSPGAPVYLWSGGSLTKTQTDALTAAATLALTETDSTHTGAGSVGFTYSAADSSFDFLAAGETLKVTYGVTVTDNHGASSIQPVTITITGTNDAPVLAADSSGANGLHAITELAGKIGDTTDVDYASGALSFTDADLDDTHTVSRGTPTYVWSGGSLTKTQTDALTAAATLTLTKTDSTHTGSGSIGFTYGAADSNFDFLAAGQTLKVTYGVTVTDNHGASSIEPVTITITGTNDAPVLAADHSGTNGTTLHAIAERAGVTGDTAHQDSASGTLSFTDADFSDTHTLSHSGPTYVLSGGTLTTTQADALTAAAQLNLNEIDSTHGGAGSVDFSYCAPDSSFDFLAAGQTLTVSYTVTVTDNSNVSSSQPVTFTITGSNDAPAVEAHNATLSYTENQAPAAIDAALTLSDVDSATLGSATVQISGHFVAGEDVLGFTDQNGIHGSYDAVHGILTLTGTSSVANYQAALASVTYFDSSDNPSAAPRTISFSVDDGAAANSHSNVATAAVNVIPVNDAPVVTFAAPGDNGISVPENTSAHLTGISVSDVDAGTSDITVTLALPDGSSGSLSAGNFDGVTIGGSAIALTITGSLAEINTFLADTRHGVTYTPATGLIHDVTLVVTANDHGATGSGGALESAPQPVLLDLVPDDLPASHANLIVNGGFETGDFSGWKLGNDIGNSNVIGINFLVGSERAGNQGAGDMAHHGLAEALFGGIGGDVTLSQSQSVATNANEHYTVDFWVMNDTSASPGEHGSGANDFSASWNGVSLMPTIVNANQSSSYTEYQFDVIGAAGHSTLEFSARNDDGYWNLDDVSVREGAPDTVNQLTDQITSASGVHAGDVLTVTAADSNSLGTVTAAAGTGAIEWQFAASNAQLDHLMGLTQTYTVSDASNPAVVQTVAVSIGGFGHDQFVFNPGVGADTMVNFSTVSNSQGIYVGDTVELDKFSNIHSVSDVLHNLSTDVHGNAVVDLGNHDSITFQGINAATIQANAMHMFVLHSTSGNIA